MRILVTRPEPEAREFADALAMHGIDAVVASLLTIEATSDPLPELGDVQALLATSANGVRAFAARSARRDLMLVAVGARTAAAARAAGFAEVASADGDWRDLAALAGRRLDPARGALLHIAGADHTGDLDGALTARGFTVRRALLYRAIAAATLPETARAALDGEPPLDGVALFSPRTARILLTSLEQAMLGPAAARLFAFCLSAAVAEPLREREAQLRWRSIHVAMRPTADSLIASIRATMAAEPSAGEFGMNDDAQAANDAERVIAAFGGIRPAAKAMNLPVTTVQGWKERGAIPLARMPEVRDAAARHGIDLARLPPVPDVAASAPRAEEVAAERVSEPLAAGVRAAEAAPPPPPVIEAGAAKGEFKRNALWFGLGCGIAFVAGALIAWQLTLGGSAASNRAAVDGLQNRLNVLVRDSEEQSRRRQAEAAAVQARIGRLEATERAIAEHRDRLSNVAATAAALATRLEKLDMDMKALAGRVPAGAGEIAGLRDTVQKLGERIDALPKEAPDAAALARLNEQAKQWGDRLTALERRIAQLAESRAPADAGEIRTALEKQAAETKAALDKLAQQAGAAAERLTRDGGALRRELSALESRVNALASDAQRGAAVASDVGALVATIGQLRQAVASGAPYRPSLDTVAAMTKDRAELAAPLKTLAAHAERGVPTTAMLRADFDRLAVAILRAAAAGEGERDWADRIWARVRTLVTVRRTGDVQGDTPRAHVSRAETSLARGDLGAAVTEIETLAAHAQRPAEAWLTGAKARLDADAALALLDRGALQLLGKEKK